MAERVEGNPGAGSASQETTRRFIDALHGLEEHRDVERLVELFAEGAELQNPVIARTQGKDGVRTFWEHYRSSFGEIHSHFLHVASGDDSALLEWRSEGTSAAGTPIRYGGVSVLEFGDGGSITNFRSYFDPARLGTQLSPTGQGRAD